MKLAYVTGATGCIGRNLVNELTNSGWDVVVLHRKSSNIARLNGCRVRLQEVDLHNVESVRQSIPNNVNAIFHVAGNTSHWSAEKDQQWRDNVLATRNLVQVALEQEVERFIFTSSGSTRFFLETDQAQAGQLQPPYVRTKRQSELEVYEGMARGLDAVILHPIIVVGRYDYNSYSQIYTGLQSGELKFAFPGSISFCHAQDVAAAHVNAYDKGRSGERYMLGGSYTTWLEFFQKVAQLVGTTSEIKVAPAWMLKAIALTSVVKASVTKRKPLLTPELLTLIRHEPDISYYDKRKTMQDLGYNSQTLDKMIKDCYDWMIEERMLTETSKKAV
jgi:dihydroflavonol-4-reductase